MSRDKKQKYLLYLVLMIVLIGRGVVSTFRLKRRKSTDCLDAGYEYDFDQKACLGNPVN